MTKRERITLAELINALKYKSLFWSPDDDTCKKVISITKRADEPSLCANFQDGKYASLDGCELSDFIIGERVNDIWRNNY